MSNSITNQPKNTQLLFSFNDKIATDFNGGDITSDGGAILLREFDEKISFIKGVNNCIHDPRNRLLVTHVQEELLRQRIFQIVLGYEDADDSDILRQDPLFQLSVKEEEWRLIDTEELASQPTISRLENRVSDKEIEGMNNFLTDTYIKSVKAKRKDLDTITLDIDSTDDPTHGEQQMSLFHGYYQERMYHPLLITDIESKLLLGAYLRPGNVHTAHEVTKHIAPVIDKLKKAFPTTKIVLREDSGFSSPRMYNYCKKEDLLFVIGISTNKVLERKTEKYVEKAKALFEAGKEKVVKLYVSFRYKAGTWDREQKIVAKIDTFRIKVLKVGAWIKETVRKIWVHFSSAWPFRNLFEEIHWSIIHSPPYSLA